MKHPMRPILFQLCRSEKDDSDSGDSDRIEETVREVCGRFCYKFDQRVVARGWSDEEVSDDVV